MISINGISKVPASRVLFMTRELRSRIGGLTEEHCDRLVRGESTKEIENDLKTYQGVLGVFARDYRKLFRVC